MASLELIKKELIGFSFSPFPNLSTVRVPEPATRSLSVDVAPDIKPIQLVVALAKCLGSYCGTTDVLVSWTSLNGERLVRVQWKDGQTWEDVLQAARILDTPATAANEALELDRNQEACLVLFREESFKDAKLPLTVGYQGGSLRFHFSSSYFHESTASVLAHQVTNIARIISNSPQTSQDDLNDILLSLQSRYNPLVEDVKYDHIKPFALVTDFITRLAHEQPDSLAVEYNPDLFEDYWETMTFRHLESKSNQFARHLIGLGVGEGDRVTVCLPRNLAFHVCMIGIFKAGACYIPVDPDLPAERQNYIKEDSQAKLALDQDSIDEHMRKASQENHGPICLASPDGLAYMLYTSGTTGRPKGCLLTHHGLSEAILALSSFAAEAGAQEGRYLAIASIAFDVHLAEIFVGWVLGMTIVSATRNQLLEDLPHWLKTLRITHVGIVPSLIEATMCAVEESPGDADDVEDQMQLRYIGSGGEKISDSILERWADHPQVKLANFYGPSEVTIGLSGRFMSPQTRKENIGRSFLNCGAYVVDDKLRVVLRGGVGELLVTGPLVGKGYHGRPDLTEKAFLEWEGQWAYRTGDLVRMMPDDTLEILGRIDTQIKLRGVRIESEGISAIIRQAASAKMRTNVDVATVLARHPSLQSDQIVSFLTWDTSVSISKRKSSKPNIITNIPECLLKAVNDVCKKELASYMRPAHIIPVEFLPLNSNGKADSLMLVSIFRDTELGNLAGISPSSSDGVQEAGPSPSTPRDLNDTEKQLAGIIDEMVPDTPLHSETNLFQIGFDSLKFIRLASGIRSLFSLGANAVVVGDLMQEPTISAISEKIELARTGSAELSERPGSEILKAFAEEWRDDVASAVDLGRVENVFPTFPCQDGILYRSASYSSLYVQHVLFQCREGVSMEKLKSAWQSVMEQHEILRTVFVFSSSIIQTVLQPGACELPWEEHGFISDDGEEFTSWFLREEAANVSTAINENIHEMPPYKLNLYSTRSTAFLALSIHHAIYDGILLPLILEDVQCIYAGKPIEESPSVSTVLQDIVSVDLEKAKDYWKKVFEGFNWARLAHGSAAGRQAEVQVVKFESKLVDVERLASKARVSLQAILTAAFATSVGRHVYKAEDVAFGVIRSGRSAAIEGIDRARCPMLSVLPVRVCISQENLLSSVQQDIARAIAFENVPLSKIQGWVRTDGPLFEMLFSISRKEDDTSDLWTVLESTQPDPDFPLAVEIIIDPKSGELAVNALYCKENISPKLVQRVLNDVETLALSLANGESFGVLTDDEEAEVSTKKGSQSSEDTLVASDETSLNPELEDEIERIVSTFLNIDPSQIPRTANFVSLGIDSIKSIGLSRRLKKTGAHVTAVDVMQHPSIRQLANYSARKSMDVGVNPEEEMATLLQQARKDIAASVDVDSLRLSPNDDVELYPVTVLQAGMLSQTVNSGGRLYVHDFPLKLSENIDTEHLKEAWRTATEMCPILRTTFHFSEEAGVWFQAVHSAADFKWSECEVIDMESENRRWIDALTVFTEYSIPRPPVFLRLLKKADNEKAQRLSLVMHHAVYDAIAVQRLFSIVAALYTQSEPQYGPPFHAFLGYFEYQQLHGTDHWTNYLSNLDPSNTSSGRSSADAEQVTHLLTHRIDIPFSSLDAFSRTNGVSIQSIGQVAWGVAWGELTKTSDVLFGHVVSGRNIAETETVLGPMLNTIPCRIRFAEKVTKLNLLREVHRNNIAALAWQHASLRAVQKTLGVLKLFDCLFLYQPMVQQDEESNKLWKFDPDENEDTSIQYAFNIELHQESGGLLARAACMSSLMDRQDAESLLRRFEQIMKEIVEHPDTPNFVVQSEDKSPETAGQVEPTSPSEATSWMPFGLAIRELLITMTGLPPKDIKLDTKLISLGIDSIFAIQLSSKLRREGIRLQASDIFNCDTLSDLQQLASGSPKEGKSRLGPKTQFLSPDQHAQVLQRFSQLDEDDIQSVLPATAGVKWLAGMWQVSKGSRYQHAFAFQLPSAGFDSSRFEKAWDKLVSRHSILRSTLASTSPSDAFLVTLKPDGAIRCSIHDLSDEGRSEVQTVASFLKEWVSNPPSTRRSPTRAAILRVGDENFFGLHLHHFQYDAWSVDLLLDDLSALYDGDERSYQDDIAPFVSFARDQTVVERQQSYWQAEFPKSWNPSFFPKLREASSFQGPETARTMYTMEHALTTLSALKRRAHVKASSLTSLFMAAWAKVHARHSGNGSAVTFGLWQLGRSGDVDNVAGLAIPCMNVLPLCIYDTDTDLPTLASQIQDTLRKRSAEIEQTDLENIHSWIGRPNEALYNVHLNVYELKSSPHPKRRETLKPLKIPHFIPEPPARDELAPIGRLSICDALNDDLMIDIIANEDDDSVIFYVESSAEFLDVSQAERLAQDWTGEIKGYFGLT